MRSLALLCFAALAVAAEPAKEATPAAPTPAPAAPAPKPFFDPNAPAPTVDPTQPTPEPSLPSLSSSSTQRTGHREGNHMALANIRERLDLHFDAEARMTHFTAGGDFVVQVEIPLVALPRH
jgi:hypothetical protein